MSANILANDPTGAHFSNDSVHFRPEVARVGFAKLPSGNREGLAGVSSANKIDCSGVLAAVKLADVAVDGDAGLVSGKHLPAISIDLTKGGGSHSCSFESE